MNAFTSRGLTSPRFVLPVAKFSHENIKKGSMEVNKAGREPDLSLPSLPTSPSVPELSVDVKIRRHVMDKHERNDKTHSEDRKSRCKNIKLPSSSSRSLIIFFTSSLRRWIHTGQRTRSTQKETSGNWRPSTTKGKEKLHRGVWLSLKPTCEYGT